MTKRRKTILISIVIVILALYNLSVYMQAKSMLRYSDSGVRTARPQEISKTELLKTLFTGINIPKPQNHLTPGDVGLMFETDTLTVDEDIALEVWYVPKEDHRAVVVMFHGYPMSKSHMMTNALEFHELNCALVMVDFRGHGGSSGYETSIGYHEADDVRAAFEFAIALSDGQPVLLFGQSMGAAAVMRSISEYDLQPDGLIIESVFDKMINAIKSRFKVLGIPSFPTAHLLLYWGGKQAGFSAFDHNPLGYAQNINTPILMLHGEFDIKASVEGVTEVFGAVPSLHKKLVLLPGAGHDSLSVYAPNLWRESVGGFLDSLIDRSE